MFAQSEHPFDVPVQCLQHADPRMRQEAPALTIREKLLRSLLSPARSVFLEISWLALLVQLVVREFHSIFLLAVAQAEDRQRGLVGRPLPHPACDQPQQVRAFAAISGYCVAALAVR
jgi:hypothetical protein